MSRGRKKGPMPQLWITGPDERLHEMHCAYRQQKNQAQFRKEGWHIEFNDWVAMWGSNWENRGRKPHQMCMRRIDNTKTWTIDNVEVINRSQFHKDQTTVSVCARWGKVVRNEEQQAKYERDREYRLKRKGNAND